MEHFEPSEFECKCGKCDGGEMRPIFYQQIDQARSEAGVPFKINSGFRCPEHNAAVGGSETSSHLKGLATDISCISSYHRFRIISALIKVGFTRIGIGKDFIHADLDHGKANEVIWLY